MKGWDLVTTFLSKTCYFLTIDGETIENIKLLTLVVL